MEEFKSNPSRGVPLWTQILIWVLLLGLLSLLGFGLVRARQGTVQAGDQVPDFSLTFYSGYEYNSQSAVKISDLRGKVVFINFWASWCKPCEQEAASLEQAWEYYQPSGKVVFLGIDYVDTEIPARAFLKKFNNTYPNGPDIGTVISQIFRIKGVPETYIIDTNGVINYVKIGPFLNVDEIKALIDPLLP
ncbi:Thiol-disulfide oxidoreductase ResA [Anaerolineales bacterium]|nr:Thiol-disulfide oxidoreductase ResA [Anaerolineales bacterium]